jgi:3-deoxy-D-manno-octulosonate 8-phosphate phosphatase (KDO 8-P phosphatase)
MLDVDGVLTDDAFFWGSNGEELKRFSFRDVMGVSLGKRAGLLFALVSGEDSPLVGRFAAKVGIEKTYQGCKDKASAVRDFAESNGLSLDEVCFMGNDVNDLPAMKIVGLAAAPADAMALVQASAAFIAARRGGDGAVRELLEELLSRAAGAR